MFQSVMQSVDQAPMLHGGNLSAARRLFPDAPEPFIDLSTGINPNSYPVPALPNDVFTRLPEPEAIARLEALAAERYGAPSPAHVVAAPGTQILLPQVAALVAPGVARVLGPTYAEHLRAARLAGHESLEVPLVAALDHATLAVVVNPNNPDGRLLQRADLLRMAGRVGGRGGILVVDEAFMEVAAEDASVVGETDSPYLVVLRSFGKFHGLAGIRLGFAVAEPAKAARLRAQLGPWAVSGPALAIGLVALADRDWAARMSTQLNVAAKRLDALLQSRGLRPRGGTALYRFIEGPSDLFERLGRGGILIRRFAERPGLFRFGLPRDEAVWERLCASLSA